MTQFPTFPYHANNGKKPKLILFGGFPDDETSSWGKEFPEALSKTYDLFFLCLPGYEKGGKVQNWGDTFDELIEKFHYTLQQINGRDTQAKNTIIAHDWGAVFTLLYQTKYPNQLTKLILLDIGIVNPVNVSLKTIFYLMNYQIWFALSFILFKFFGREVGNFFMKLFFHKCYTYFQLWKNLFSGKVLKQSFPIVPTLFLQKRCMFHDEVFLSKLKAREDCDYKELDAGHWLQIAKPKETLDEIIPFLAKK